MEITSHIDGEEIRVTLQGRLDAAWSETVKKALQDSLHSGCHVIALDMSRVTFLSSAGIRVLLSLAKQLQGIGGRLRVVDPSIPVHKVLELVGFNRIVEVGPETPEATARLPAEPRHRQVGQHTIEVYDLTENATLRGRLLGEPAAALAGKLAGDSGWTVQLPSGLLCLGLGALGGKTGAAEHAGELLAVGGLTIVLPGDDPTNPDWLAQESDLVPEATLLYGLEASGDFRHLLRFGSPPESVPIRLSELGQSVLDVCQTDVAAFAAAAETAGLIGAARQSAPGKTPSRLFEFPGIRNQLLFTTEPAFGDETCLIVGIVARDPSSQLADFLRPMGTGTALQAHVHCAVVPYKPIHKGLIELHLTIDSLMENQRIRGVLHLLSDQRPGIGVGESALRRGALWCAPLLLTEVA